MKYLFLIYCFNIFANIDATHPELCLIYRELLPGDRCESVVKVVGDPHEFSPSVDEIKKMISSKKLLVGPMELHPWVKTILFQRSKGTSQTTIVTEKNLLKKISEQNYLKASVSTLSHFWLYSDVFCQMKRDFAEQLKITMNFNECMSRGYENEKILSSQLQKISRPIIITHDALVPLFLKLKRKDQFIFSLKTSDHHDEIKSKTIKELNDILKKEKSVVWLLENEIEIPMQLKNLIRKSDKIIRIETGYTKNGIGQSQILEISKGLIE